MVRSVDREIELVEKSYVADGRLPLAQLYSKYEELVKKGWQKEIICIQKRNTPSGIIEFPIYAYLSPKTAGGQGYLWIMGGVHGEEPAGPNAFVQEIEFIGSLPEINRIPVVFIPLLNPDGYSRNWRYANERRDTTKGLSVTDSEHLLPKIDDPTKPRRLEAVSETTQKITRWILDTSLDRQPILVMDHHEDEMEPDLQYSDSKSLYSYASGESEILRPLSIIIVNCLTDNNVILTRSGTTRAGETIENGFVINTADGSVDEMLSSGQYFVDGQIHSKKPARAVFVIETTLYKDGKIPLGERVRAHRAIIKIYSDLLDQLKKS